MGLSDVFRRFFLGKYHDDDSTGTAAKAFAVKSIDLSPIVPCWSGGGVRAASASMGYGASGAALFYFAAAASIMAHAFGGWMFMRIIFYGFNHVGSDAVIWKYQLALLAATSLLLIGTRICLPVIAYHNQKFAMVFKIVVVLIPPYFSALTWQKTIPHEVSGNVGSGCFGFFVFVGASIGCFYLLTAKDSIRNAPVTKILKNMHMVAWAPVLTSLFFLVASRLDTTGSIHSSFVVGSIPLKEYRICEAYVTTYRTSPRKENLIPELCRQLDESGVPCHVVDGPEFTDVESTETKIRSLIQKGYFSIKSFTQSPCRGIQDNMGSNSSTKLCLRPIENFDRRITHIGTAMGHIQSIEHFLGKRGTEKDCLALIFEDDAILTKNFLPVLKNELKTLNATFDMLNLEGSETTCKANVLQNEGLGLFHPIKLTEHMVHIPFGVWSGVYAGAYTVSVQGAHAVLGNLPVTSNIDTWYDSSAFYGRLQQLVRCPEGLVMQGSISKWSKKFNVTSLVAREGAKYDKGGWVDNFSKNKAKTASTRSSQ